MNETKIQPAPYYILVLPSPVDSREKQTDSGLVIIHNDETLHKPRCAVVFRLGDMVRELEGWSEIMEGDVVYYCVSHQIGDIEVVLATNNNVVAWEANH